MAVRASTGAGSLPEGTTSGSAAGPGASRPAITVMIRTALGIILLFPLSLPVPDARRGEQVEARASLLLEDRLRRREDDRDQDLLRIQRQHRLEDRGVVPLPEAAVPDAAHVVEYRDAAG